MIGHIGWNQYLGGSITADGYTIGIASHVELKNNIYLRIATMTHQELIEKLESLPRYEFENDFHGASVEPDELGEFIKYNDLRAIISEHKAECEMPKNSTSIEALISDFDKDPLVNKSLDYSRSRLKEFLSSKSEQSEPVAYVVKFMRNTGIDRVIVWNKSDAEKQVKKELIIAVLPLYTAPQPTPQNVIDAELGKLVRQKMQSGNDIPVSRCVITREEFDQAMKGE